MPILIIGKDGAAAVRRTEGRPRRSDAANKGQGPGQRRTTMQTMNASIWMEKFGLTVINAVMLAGLPLGLVAALIQSF